MIKNVKAIEANFEAHDLNISQENKDIIWDEVDVRDVVCFVHIKRVLYAFLVVVVVLFILFHPIIS